MIFIEKIVNHPQARHNLKWRYDIIARIMGDELWIYENGIKHDPTEILKVEIPINVENGVRFIDNKEWIENILSKSCRFFGSGDYKVKDFSGKGKGVGNHSMVIFKGYIP